MKYGRLRRVTLERTIKPSNYNTTPKIIILCMKNVEFILCL